MKTIENLISKPIGEVLKEAGLINSGQLQVALMEQDVYPDLELEEILLLHGWLEQKTMDFFVGMFKKPYFDKTLIIGQLFYQAGLLTREQIELIVNEQQRMGLPFGSVAVLRGYIKQETLDFFVTYFISERQSETISQSKKTWSQTSAAKTKEVGSKLSISSYEELVESGLDDIPWID